MLYARVAITISASTVFPTTSIRRCGLVGPRFYFKDRRQRAERQDEKHHEKISFIADRFFYRPLRSRPSNRPADTIIHISTPTSASRAHSETTRYQTYISAQRPRTLTTPLYLSTAVNSTPSECHCCKRATNTSNGSMSP